MHYAFMLLFEANGKSLFHASGIMIPDGATISSPEALDDLNIDFPVALKIQVASGGRGKAGGVRRCNNLKDARTAAFELFHTRFDGECPRMLLVESWLDIARELYLAVTIDARSGGFVVLYGAKGGVDVDTGPPPLRYAFGAPTDFRGYLLREILETIEPDRGLRDGIVALARRLLQVARNHECITAEINPLVLLGDGSLVAGDAKVIRDDAAAFRHA